MFLVGKSVWAAPLPKRVSRGRGGRHLEGGLVIQGKDFHSKDVAGGAVVALVDHPVCSLAQFLLELKHFLWILGGDVIDHVFDHSGQHLALVLDPHLERKEG